jgi:hypothetical protein
MDKIIGHLAKIDPMICHILNNDLWTTTIALKQAASIAFGA